jgi:hypothetical protein
VGSSTAKVIDLQRVRCPRVQPTVMPPAHQIDTRTVRVPPAARVDTRTMRLSSRRLNAWAAHTSVLCEFLRWSCPPYVPAFVGATAG